MSSEVVTLPDVWIYFFCVYLVKSLNDNKKAQSRPALRFDFPMIVI